MKRQHKNLFIHGIINLLILFAFQNCRLAPENLQNPQQQEDSLSSLELTTEQEATDKTKKESEVDINEEISLLPNERETRVLIQWEEGDLQLAGLQLALMTLNKDAHEGFFRWRGRKDHPHFTTITCVHSRAEGTLSFDCSNLDEFIVENITPGKHRIGFQVQTQDGSIFEGRALILSIP